MNNSRLSDLLPAPFSGATRTVAGDLAADHFIGDGSQLTGLPTGTTYQLSAATTSTLGGVVVGSGLTVNAQGVVSVPTGTTDMLVEGTKNLYFTPGRTIASVLTGYARATTNRAIAATDSVLVGLELLEKQVADVKTYAQSKQYGLFNENYGQINTSSGNGAYRLLANPGSATDYMTLYTPLSGDAGVLAQAVCQTSTSQKTSRLAVQYIPSGATAAVTICTLAPGETALCGVVLDTSNKAKWVLFAKERSTSVVDINATPQAIQSAVRGGTFTNGELQGTQPVGSIVGMRFTDTSYRYEYMTSSGDTNGTSFAWVRTSKG